jgi:cobalt-precorrin 5A hydrolase/precorrin-3B C17-methyltransferase
VALISSGDAGIYAMASLVFELLHHEEREDWNRVKVMVVPGISALQAAAARIGAPLGHDFCAISLSDLLTPREDILKRVRAAAEGDFVVAFYNPVSMRRRDLLEEARDILLSARPLDTPVVLACNLGREGEDVSVTTLEVLTTSQADMLTLVLVGNSHSRAVQRGESLWVYTPRGYGNKKNPASAPGADRKRSAG